MLPFYQRCCPSFKTIFPKGDLCRCPVGFSSKKAFLPTRDSRIFERKKAGLHKARKGTSSFKVLEPPDDKTWLQLHYLIVVMAVIFTLIWKWRQETTIPYKHVDQATTPQLELQPLNFMQLFYS